MSVNSKCGKDRQVTCVHVLSETFVLCAFSIGQVHACFVYFPTEWEEVRRDFRVGTKYLTRLSVAPPCGPGGHGRVEALELF